MKLTYIAAALITAFCAPAWAVNKCIGPDGATVFQDTPCSGKGGKIDLRPAAGNALEPAPLAPGVKPQTETERIEKQISESQRDRRKRDLQDRLVPDARASLEGHRSGCEQTQKRLEASQYRYVQNLYGKTHAAQVASEMAASAATCGTKERELKENLNALQKECSELNGCK